MFERLNEEEEREDVGRELLPTVSDVRHRDVVAHEQHHRFDRRTEPLRRAALAGALPDPAGTFWRYGWAAGMPARPDRRKG